MHGLDFWNNPLVVSAFRVKYRRRSPTILSALYVMLLVGLGMILYTYYPPTNPRPWTSVYFLCIIGLQFCISGVWTLLATGNSLQSEVANRTLDFQRIVSLSPRQIMLGKLLGEPAECYLMAMSTLPLTLWCSAEGAVSLGVWALLYVQLATLSLAMGTLGLLQNLEPPAGKPVGTRQGSLWISVIFILLFTMPSLLGNLPFLTRQPWTQAVLGLFTPLLVLHDLFDERSWQAQFSWFWWSAPYLLVAPIAQIGLAALAFEAAARRLTFPRNPPVSKRRALALLLAFDVLAAGVVWDGSRLPTPADQRMGSFLLAHVLVGIVITLWITPQREVLVSWIWRFRGQKPWLPDVLWGNRTENTLAVLAFALCGPLVAGLLVWWPAEAQGPSGVRSAGQIWASVGSASLTLAAWGWTYQYFLLAAGRHGRIPYLMLLMLVLVAPWVAGVYFHVPAITALSPVAVFADWVDSGAPSLPMAPLAVESALLAALARFGTRTRLARHVAVVERKLQTMAVAD